MNPTANASPWVFFALVFCLSVPFYVLGAAGGRLPVLTARPTSALMAFMPMIAALILVYRGRGADKTANLVKRALDFGQIPVFFAMYFVGAIGDELGWQGHAFPELRKRYSALSAAVLLGVSWSLWHVIPFFQRTGSCGMA